MPLINMLASEEVEGLGWNNQVSYPVKNLDMQPSAKHSPDLHSASTNRWC